MAKTIKLLTVLAVLLLTFSFTTKDVTNFIGTYGVCASDPSQIKLTLNPDHTFSYQDFSIADKKIHVKGNWILKGKKVILNDNNNNKNQ